MRRYEQTFFQRRRPDSQETHEKMFNVTYHQGNANQNYNKYHLTPVRMAKTDNIRNNRYWWGCGEKEPSYTVGGNANWCSYSGKQYGGPQKVKNRTTLWSSNCTTRYLPKEYKNSKSKGYMHLDVYSSIIYNSQTMEIAQVSIYWWMDKEDVVLIWDLHERNIPGLNHQLFQCRCNLSFYWS